MEATGCGCEKAIRCGGGGRWSGTVKVIWSRRGCRGDVERARDFERWSSGVGRLSGEERGRVSRRGGYEALVSGNSQMEIVAGGRYCGKAIVNRHGDHGCAEILESASDRSLENGGVCVEESDFESPENQSMNDCQTHYSS